MEWLNKATDQGNVYAEYVLGTNYLNGYKGFKKDITKGVNFIMRSAKHGFAGAQTILGSCYLLGVGVAQNTAEGFKWLRKAAEQGDPEAINALRMAGLY